MTARNLADRFSLADVIEGLATDLAARRAGTITIEDARVRAEMAKQMISAVRLFVQTQKFLEQQMRAVPQVAGTKGT